MGTIVYDQQAVAAAELERRRRLALRLVPHTAYQHDPIGWAVDKLGIREATLRWRLNDGYDAHTWNGTVDPLAAMFDSVGAGRDTGVESATGTGKSYGAAILSLWFPACYEGGLVFTFAPKEDQLKRYIWKHIGEFWPRFTRHFPTATLTDLTLRMRGGLDESWGVQGNPVGIRAGEQVSTKASGMHAEHMLLIYEELQGIDQRVIEAGENACTAPHNFRLGLGNPNSRLDTLHKFSTSPGVTHIRVSALDHPNVVAKNPNLIPGAVSQASIDRRRVKYGESSPVYQSRVLGESPEQAADALIRLEWLEASAKRYAKRLAAGTIPDTVTGKGVDVANSEHGDRGAICDFSGTAVTRLDAFPCPDANQLGRTVVADAKAQGLAPHRVGVDSIGVGAGTVNEARRLDFSLQALNFGAKPIVKAERAPDGSRYEWVPDANRFRNRRGQTYWQLREDFQAGQIDMAKDADVWEELLAVTFEDDASTVDIIAKDDIRALLGRSPDKSDALAMANWVRVRQIVKPDSVVKDTKSPHRAIPIVVKDGRVIAVKRQPQTLEQLMDAVEAKHQGRLVHRERLPARRYR